MDEQRGVALVALDWQSRLGPAIEAVITAMSEHVPETTAPGIAEIVRVTQQGNLSTLVGHMARGVPLELVAPSAELTSLTASLAELGFALPTIMRAYHVGAEETVRQWMLEVERQQWPRDESLRTIQEGTRFMLQWLIALTDGVTTIYNTEAERLVKNRDFAQIERVRRILGDEDVSESDASRELGYRLAGCHVALVQILDGAHQGKNLNTLSEHGSVFEESLQKLHLPNRLGGALHIRVDLHTVWSWLPSSWEAIKQLDAVNGPVHVGIGTARTGLAGFRASHREALEAVRVAQLRGRPSGHVTRFDQSRLVSLCTQDAQRAREFVAIELGPLGARTPTMNHLRRTLSTYLASNSNARATAAKLYVHHNTVRAHIARAEAELGRSVSDRRLVLELALHIDDALRAPGAS